jgi:hypothetical protein
MHSRSWNRCLALDPMSGAWCRGRPSDGVLCSSHATEFRADEAAKAATRLARARLVVWDPSTTPIRKWWATVQLRRARSLRRNLLAKVARAEGNDSDIADLSMDLVLPEDIGTWG